MSKFKAGDIIRIKPTAFSSYRDSTLTDEVMSAPCKVIYLPADEEGIYVKCPCGCCDHLYFDNNQIELYNPIWCE